MARRRPPAPPVPADRALWQEISAATKPLRKRNKIVPSPVPSPLASPDSVPPAAPPARAMIPPRPWPGDPVPAPQAASPAEPGPGPQDLRDARAAGLDKRTEMRLRRGLMAIEDEIDLHGLSRAEAAPRLADFLAESEGRGLRLVLVITGRGRLGEGGVLRRELPGWLGQAPNRRRVLAFVPARPQHGGDGAFYVLLRRRRAPGSDGIGQ
ncbi:MAG: Smr/MutS family protein [Alphaproteobacteria bacterium]